MGRDRNRRAGAYFFQFAPTFYFSDRGYFAGRIEGSYDLLITNRLILQPQIEMNFYSKSQPNRGVGSGLSEIDTGLRLRYEITRKFAPYIGFAYTGSMVQTASFTRQEGGNTNDPRFVFGARIWYSKPPQDNGVESGPVRGGS